MPDALLVDGEIGASRFDVWDLLTVDHKSPKKVGDGHRSIVVYPFEEDRRFMGTVGVQDIFTEY